jgi:hypothetical protein
MRWRKRGLIYAPSGERWWERSYATIPTAERLDDRVLRIYFASLDEHLRGRIGWVDVEARDPSRILRETAEPVLDLGAPGLFDDSGVNPSCLVEAAGKKYFYYIGWQRCERVPYMLFAGLALATEDGRFEKLQPTPVLDRTPEEPFLRSATSILWIDGFFRAWYVSGLGWEELGGKLYPTYTIRFAESADGIHWQSRSEPCLSLEGDEFGFGRPWVLRDEDRYCMWYSIRSRSAPYRIGYAESRDGLHWLRKDGEAGIERSAEGWDSEMICYPCVLDVAGERYMFYNGNRHGATGFGYAVLES